MISRDENLGELGEWFDRLSRMIEREGLLGHLNINTEIEYFFRDVLNCLYGWKLSNANDLFGKNAEAIDLSSTSDKVALQVTTTQTSTKIRKTLTAFVPKMTGDYDRLIFIYPSMKKSASTADFSKQLVIPEADDEEASDLFLISRNESSEPFDFVADRDRWDLSDLYKKAQTLSVERQKALLELVREELKPLGKALQMGVEPSVEILIGVIAHMVSAGNPDEVLEYDPPANIVQKLERFKEHADFLKRQFLINRNFYIPVEEARKAVGYDAANVPRIRLWLIQNSLSSLEKHNGNGKEAFEALVKKLLKLTKKNGSDADNTAVSYLIADEFFRCNVFPNPEELESLTKE